MIRFRFISQKSLEFSNVSLSLEQACQSCSKRFGDVVGVDEVVSVVVDAAAAACVVGGVDVVVVACVVGGMPTNFGTKADRLPFDED